MEHIDWITLHYGIISVINFIIEITLVVTAIIIYNKVKSIGTRLMLIGSILLLITFVLNFLDPIVTSRYYGIETMQKTQVVMNYVDSLKGILYCLGFLLFAINDLKKINNDTRA